VVDANYSALAKVPKALLPAAARRIGHELWIESFTPPFSTSFVPLFARGPVVGFAQNPSGREMSHRYKLPFFLIERFGLRLAQPAHRARSHAAWQVARRHPGSLVRETAYVEIGPLVAFHAVTFDVLLPFPPLRIGWGLDAHWAAVAHEHGWRLGVVDATPIRHGLRRIAAAYHRDEAIAEARRFLADKPYVKAVEAQRTLVTHRSCR